MKPNWKDAPDWAQWLSQDADGEWFWSEEEPEYGVYVPGQWFVGQRQFQYAGRSELTAPAKEHRP